MLFEEPWDLPACSAMTERPSARRPALRRWREARPGRRRISVEHAVDHVAGTRPVSPWYCWVLLIADVCDTEMCVSLRISWVARPDRLDMPSAGATYPQARRGHDAAGGGAGRARFPASSVFRSPEMFYTPRRTSTHIDKERPQDLDGHIDARRQQRATANLRAWLPTFESAIVTALHEWAENK